jgi:hypothetical protein
MPKIIATGRKPAPMRKIDKKQEYRDFYYQVPAYMMSYKNYSTLVSTKQKSSQTAAFYILLCRLQVTAAPYP